MNINAMHSLVRDLLMGRYENSHLCTHFFSFIWLLVAKLSVVKLSVVKLSVVELSVVKLSVVKLSVVKLSVVKLRL